MSESEWFNQRAAAAYLGVHVSYLERRRKLGMSPRYSKIGRIVRYQKAELDRFLASGIN